MKKIAIFASGNGTNAQRISEYFSDNPNIEISIILSDRKNAYVLERARKLNIPSRYFTKQEWLETDDILNLIKELDIDLIVLAGFLKLVPPSLIAAFPHQIINIHPALLPKFGGKGMYGERVHEAVIAAHEKQSGITIHYVNEHFDEGTTIFQATCPITAEDTPETLAQKIHLLEYEHFPKVIETLLV